MSFSKPDYLLILLLIFAAVILVTNLGNIYLWQDEAYTAVIARNTLTFGIPQCYDGKNLAVNVLRDRCMFKPTKYSSWLQYYLTALSFRLFGATTFAARLPFVLFGIGSAGLCYSLAQRAFANRFVSRIACALMVFSAPFFLYSRQCRWYALSMFFTLAVLLSYIGTLEKRKRSGLAFIASSVLLFNSIYGIFFPVMIALAAHCLVFNRSQLRRYIKYFITIGLLILPVLIYYASTELAGTLSLARTKGHLEFYFRVLNKYIFPCGLFFISMTVFGIFRKKAYPLLGRPLNKSYLWLFVYMYIFTILFLLLADERQLRYLVHLLPLSAILMAVLITGLLKVNKPLSLLLFIVVCFTNILHMGAPFRKKLWIPQVSIFDQLTHDYDGPVEGIVRYLQENAKSTDTVKINYGDCAVMFYTDLKVDNAPFGLNSFPEWIVTRVDWAPWLSLDSQYRQQIEARYERIVLNYPDIQWENRPDPGYHKFRTVTNPKRSKVVVYKKK
ncbi:glycosyltransferase family 39 protein [Candidatus Omnitrophota bacterium]